ncbi:MAG TPA: wax ester/triacylglycerol synthase family O-acyltransferase [Candidatus Hydrogenedentes bacterium]|nr:wax ester/triacylglycerol synthase family O-acyltransferase [Candidatus Hydrogenedentota bacterium]
MSEDGLERRLSPMDAFFLYLEREEQPLHVGAVCVFERRMPFGKFVRTLESRLHLVPRYRQRVLFTPLHLGHPTWEVDPDFDIKNHVFRLRLPAPGTDEELRQLTGQVFTGVLDRNKPLWELYFVEGLEDNRTALIVKVHHCMVDGIAGIGLALVLLDIVPNAPKINKPRFRPTPLPDAKTLCVDALWDNAADALRHWSRWQRSFAAYARGFDLLDVARNIKRFAATMGHFLLPFTRMPFNVALNGERIVHWREYSFADARAIRTVIGGTVNDVILTALGTAARRLWQETQGSKRIPQTLRVLVPVNVRRETERAALGNHTSLMPVELPLHPEGPVERLRATDVLMRQLKEARVAEAIALMFDVVQGTPAFVQALALGTVGHPIVQETAATFAAPIPPANLICTNVPGPQIPLYSCGHKLLAMYPALPVALEMGVNLAITSYDQKLFITFIGDGKAEGELERVAELFDVAFQELLEAAAVKQAQYVEITRRRHETATEATA